MSVASCMYMLYNTVVHVFDLSCPAGWPVGDSVMTRSQFVYFFVIVCVHNRSELVIVAGTPRG